MTDSKTLIARVSIIGALAFIALLTYFPSTQTGVSEQGAGSALASGACEAEELCVIFFDVGQGDAIFIQSPTGVQVLIDGGRSTAVLRGLATELGFFDRSLDMVVATHPDADHIGGLVDVLERYDVELILRTENESDSEVSELFDARVESEDAEVVFARRGQRYELGGGAILEVLFPEHDTTGMESNESSIIGRLQYGTTSFLLTGDAPKRVEEYLVLVEGEHLASDVLKVGHHGSRTSTSEMFLSEVMPTYAVISASTDNSYGHPHVEVTDLLFNYGVEIKNTAEGGSIVFISNGEQVELR